MHEQLYVHCENEVNCEESWWLWRNASGRPVSEHASFMASKAGRTTLRESSRDMLDVRNNELNATATAITSYRQIPTTVCFRPPCMSLNYRQLVLSRSPISAQTKAVSNSMDTGSPKSLKPAPIYALL